MDFPTRFPTRLFSVGKLTVPLMVGFAAPCVLFEEEPPPPHPHSKAPSIDTSNTN
jgi:hypothetical protein